MARHPARLSQVHALSSAQLDRVAMMVRERYFIAQWEPVTIEPQQKTPAHGGRVPLKPSDIWQLFMLDDGAEEIGCQVDVIMRFRSVPGRLLCEIARLEARAKLREIARARKQAIARERNRWEGSEVTLDNEGKARLRKKIKEIKQMFPAPKYKDEIGSLLSSWGVYHGVPSRTTLHRLSAGTDRRKLYAYILMIHLWKRRAFRFITP